MSYTVKEQDIKDVKTSVGDVKTSVGEMKDSVKGVEDAVSGTYKKFFSDFQQFMYSNNVLVAATGFCVGMATKEVIEKLLNLIVLPLVQVAMKYSIVHIAYYKSVAYISRPELLLILTTFGEILWSLFVWIVIIILTFFMLEYLLNRNVLGLRSVVKEGEKINYVKAKAEAKENIIPTKQEVKQLEKEEKAEDKAGKQLQKIEDKNVKRADKDSSTAISVVADKSKIITDESKVKPVNGNSSSQTQLPSQSQTPSPTQIGSPRPNIVLDTFFAPLHF
jgi:large-conductance mechanosensitive channel